MTDASPSKGGSKWSARLGTAVRRSSTLLSIPRSSTPTAPGDKDSETRSLRKSSSGNSLRAATPVPALAVSSPSPIAESPAREAAAFQEALGPSPLAQSTTDNLPDDQRSPEVAPTVEEQTSPTGYVPPPVLDSTVGNPGAFTDDPDILPQPETVVDPYAAPPPQEEPVATDPTERSSPEPIFATVLAESIKSAKSLSVPADADAAAPVPLPEEPTNQDQAPVEPGFTTAVMPNYNVWASGSTQDLDKRSVIVPVAVVASQTSSIKAPEPQHFKDPFADPPLVLSHV